MNTIQERILQYLEFKGITPYRFCKDLGFSMGYLDKKGAIGTDKYLKIIEYYSDINPNWLLSGKEEMLNDESKIVVIKAKEVILQEKIIEMQEKEIARLEGVIIELKKEIEASGNHLHVAEPREELKKEPKK